MDQSVNPSKKLPRTKCQNILNTFRRVHRDLKKTKTNLGVSTRLKPPPARLQVFAEKPRDLKG